MDGVARTTFREKLAAAAGAVFDLGEPALEAPERADLRGEDLKRRFVGLLSSPDAAWMQRSASSRRHRQRARPASV